MNLLVLVEFSSVQTTTPSSRMCDGLPSMTRRSTALCPISRDVVCLKRAPFAEISQTETTTDPNCAGKGGLMRNRSFVRRLRAAASYISIFGRTRSTYSTKCRSGVIWLTHAAVRRDHVRLLRHFDRLGERNPVGIYGSRSGWRGGASRVRADRASGRARDVSFVSRGAEGDRIADRAAREDE